MMDSSDVAVTLTRGWARAELDAGCVLAPWSEARERTLHALALYGIDAAVIEAHEQRIASAWEGAKLAHDAGVAWVARVCMEREEALKERDAARRELAARQSHLGELHRQQQTIFRRESQIADLENQVRLRSAEADGLRKQLLRLEKRLAEGPNNG